MVLVTVVVATATVAALGGGGVRLAVVQDEVIPLKMGIIPFDCRCRTSSIYTKSCIYHIHFDYL